MRIKKSSKPDIEVITSDGRVTQEGKWQWWMVDSSDTNSHTNDIIIAGVLFSPH